jgi:serine/threonine-protein kinase SRPK3
MSLKIPLYWGSPDDLEDIRCYYAGGFHPICLGDVLSADSPLRQYRILHKLGHGAYATVWLAETLHLPS